ncbi:hypothetical protein D3C72_2271960 [compost metagenome]
MRTVTGTISQYNRNEVSSGIPKSLAGGTLRPPVPPVNFQLAKMKCAMNDAAMVAIARYSPLTRSDGMPTMRPPTMATKPPASRFSKNGVPTRVSSTATV